MTTTVCFHALVGAFFVSSDDNIIISYIPVQQTTYRIGNNHVYYWVWLRSDLKLTEMI